MRSLPSLLSLLSLLSLTACRDGAAPFTLDNPLDTVTTGQLTYSVRNDHAPVFNKNVDSVYYQADTYPTLPPTRGMLLGIPRQGGTVNPLMPLVQIAARNTPWLTAPAVSPDGNNIAFFEITDFRDREYEQISCPTPPLTPRKDTLGTNSFLQGAVLRVRTIQDNGPDDVAQLRVTFPGRTGTANTAFPFQRMFEIDAVPIFRASWSPDGTKLAFSNGAGIRVWTVGQPSSVALAGTDDGILPAWSPDGTWIAFSRPVRPGTSSFNCSGLIGGRVADVIARTVYTPYTRENNDLLLIHPDGTGLKPLGIGDAPAWSTDSKTIVVHRFNNLVKVSIDTGVATPVPNSIAAFEPAVSRDGKFLAFARRTEVGDGELNSRGRFNIWVAAF